MINFETYCLLQESLGMHNLGVKPVQSIGIQSNRPGLGEAGLPPELDAKKGKKPFGDEEEPGMAGPIGDDIPPEGDDLGGEDFGGEGEEGDDLGGSVDVHAKIAELEAEIEKLKAQIGGDEEGDDMDADLDHDDDLNDLDGEAAGGEEPELPFQKGKSTPFMKKESAGELKDSKGGDGPVFMMKKAKKCGEGMNKKVMFGQKKCNDGGMMKKKCDKCSEKMTKEATGYERPQAIDNSEDAWLNSIRTQISNSSVNQKFSDGMRKFTNEDLLLAPVGGGLEAVPDNKPVVTTADSGDLGFTNEALKDIMARLASLEK